MFVNPSDMSPTTAAPFLAAVVNCKDNHPSCTTQLSPDKQLLLKRSSWVDGTNLSDGTKAGLKQHIAKHYIKRRTLSRGRTTHSNNSPPPKRRLSFHEMSNNTSNDVTSKATKSTLKPPPPCRPPQPTHKKLTPSGVSAPADVTKSPSAQPSTAAGEHINGGVSKTHKSASYNLWNSVKGIDRTDLHHAKLYLETEFPHLSPRETQLDKSQTYKIHIYQCIIIKKPKLRRGKCLARIYEKTTKTPTNVKVRMDPQCECRRNSHSPRGLTNDLRHFVDSLLESNPTIQPRLAQQQVLSHLSTTNQTRMTDRNYRKKTLKQVKRRIHFWRSSHYKNSDITPPINMMGDLIAFKEKYVFHLPKKPNKKLLDEPSLQSFGKQLTDQKLLITLPPLVCDIPVRKPTDASRFCAATFQSQLVP